MAAPPDDIIGRIDYWAAVQPGKTVFSFLGDSGAIESSQTYGSLSSQSRAIAAGLAMRAPAGARVLLVFLPSLDFVLAFLACLRAGLVPVPEYPPDPRRSRAPVAAFAATAADCGVKSS